MITIAEVIRQMEEQIEMIHDLPNTFYLTGSMFFVGRGNDIDLFVQNDGQIIGKLKELGFTEISKEHYGDNNCVTVLRFPHYEKWNNYQVDIQVVIDAKLKERVQEKLKELGYVRPTKEEWNFAFSLLRS